MSILLYERAASYSNFVLLISATTYKVSNSKAPSEFSPYQVHTRQDAAEIQSQHPYTPIHTTSITRRTKLNKRRKKNKVKIRSNKKTPNL